MTQHYPHIPALIQESAPAAEPISLNEAKLYLRVDQADEDSLLNLMITTARKQVEQYISRSLITQSWLMSFEESVPNEVSLLHGPVQSVTSVKTITELGVETTISSDKYALVTGKDRLSLDTSFCEYRIEIRYVAGFGDVGSDVPADIRQAIFSQLAALYDVRPGEVGLVAQARALLNPYRQVRL